MSHYGPLAEVVSSSSALAAAAGAVTVTFTKRARWQPPEEVVPAAVSRVAACLTSIAIAVLWAFRQNLGQEWLALLSGLGAVLAVAALAVAIRTNVEFAYFYPSQRTEKNRKLGGSTLTVEASQIRHDHHLTVQQLFEDARGDKDLVWTRSSQAQIHIRSTLSFIILIAAGSFAIASAGLLLADTALH